MSIILYDPDAHVQETKLVLCPFHKTYPGSPWIGSACGCGFAYSQRKATPEEYRASKLKRLETKKKQLLNDLEFTNQELERLSNEQVPSNDKEDSGNK